MSAVFFHFTDERKGGTKMLSNLPEGQTANKWWSQNFCSHGIFLSPAHNYDTVLSVQRKRRWGGLVGWEQRGESGSALCLRRGRTGTEFLSIKM